MIRLTDRVTYTLTYRVALPTLAASVRILPTGIVRALAFRADRREAAAEYEDAARRGGLLRRMAVDRFDARSDAAVIYWRELQVRAGRWPRAVRY